MILELTKQDILNLTNESKRKNNQPSREDDGHCTACMTGQRWKRNGGCPWIRNTRPSSGCASPRR